MESIAQCPNCGRPLQQNQKSCIYCNHLLSEAEVQELLQLIETGEMETVRKRAEAVMLAGVRHGKKSANKAKWQYLIVLFSALAVLGMSWMSGWNIWVVVASSVFFTYPIIRMYKRSSS